MPTDAIHDLEQRVLSALPDTASTAVLQAVDEWRQAYGGCRIYVAAVCKVRRVEQVQTLRDTGATSQEIAERVGVSPQHVRRLSKRSTYLGR